MDKLSKRDRGRCHAVFEPLQLQAIPSRCVSKRVTAALE